jgi:hypothetical protein
MEKCQNRSKYEVVGLHRQGEHNPILRSIPLPRRGLFNARSISISQGLHYRQRKTHLKPKLNLKPLRGSPPPLCYWSRKHMVAIRESGLTSKSRRCQRLQKNFFWRRRHCNCACCNFSLQHQVMVYLALYPGVDIDASCMDMPKLEANQSCMQHRLAILIHLTRWIPILI